MRTKLLFKNSIPFPEFLELSSIFMAFSDLVAILIKATLCIVDGDAFSNVRKSLHGRTDFKKWNPQYDSTSKRYFQKSQSVTHESIPLAKNVTCKKWKPYRPRNRLHWHSKAAIELWILRIGWENSSKVNPGFIRL